MPVLLKTPTWTVAACNTALPNGAHSSANDHKNFLHYKLAGMVETAGYWLGLPYSAVQHATDL